jgi:hypothetical protein
MRNAVLASGTPQYARGQLLAVDSKFGFPLAAAIAADRVVPIDLF